MLMESARCAIVDYGRRMAEARLCVGTSGNISVCDRDAGLMAISPSGIGYSQTLPEDVVVMDLGGNVVEGHRKPSSEHELHTAFYLVRPDAGTVVHTHSAFATTLSTLGEPIRSVHFAILGAGTDEVPCVPYMTFGTPELAQMVAAQLEALPAARAVLMANHGLVCCATDLDKAFSLAVDLEFCSQLQWQAMCVGTPRLIGHDEMASSLERLRTYGQ